MIDFVNDFQNIHVVSLIYWQSLARGHEERQEIDFAQQFRMFIEQPGIRLEAAYDILGRLNAIHTHNCLFTQQWLDFFGSAFACRALYHAAFLGDRDRDGIGAYLGAAPLPPDGSLFKVDDGAFEQGTRAF